MPTVFICHSSVDKPFSRMLYADLLKHGIRVWIDEKEISVGDSIYESIENGLKNSDYTIVVISEKALKRPWVRRELSASFSLEVESEKKRILPILIEDCDIPIFLKDKKYADFCKSYDEGLHDLLRVFGIDQQNGSAMEFFTLNSIVTLDIIKTDGSIANYEKVTRRICLREGIDSITEYFTADGFMEKYEVNPGSIIKTWQEAGITYIQTDLPKGLRKGDKIDRVFKLVMRNSFMNDSEYWEGKQEGPAEQHLLIIKFPKDRPPKKWNTTVRDATKVVPSTWQAEYAEEDGRPMLRLDVKQPVMYRHYVTRWEW